MCGTQITAGGAHTKHCALQVFSMQSETYFRWFSEAQCAFAQLDTAKLR